MPGRVREAVSFAFHSVRWFFARNASMWGAVLIALSPWACVIPTCIWPDAMLIDPLGSSVAMLSLAYVIMVCGAYTEYCAGNTGGGLRPPIPRHRLTSVSRTGEVTMDPSDLPEALIYLADLEDYFERTGQM